MTGYADTAVGFGALSHNTTGQTNNAIGIYALRENTEGSFNNGMGNAALLLNTTGSGNTAIGSSAVVDASNKIRLGDTNVTVIEGQVPYTFTSDKHHKETFRAVDGEDVLSKISQLTLTSWNYIGHDPQQFRHYGPVAQEFFAAFGHDGVGTIGTPTTINSGDRKAF